MDGRLSRGFSLIEVVTAMALGLLLVAGLLSLFRAQAAVARRQSQAADLQQSLRIARHELARFCRMAGRGGLPERAALSVRNNAGARDRIGGAASAGVVPGTDVLVVRGVFDGSMLEVAESGGGPAAGRLTLRRRDGNGVVQELEPLAEAAGGAAGEALLLAGAPGAGECAIVELAALEGSRLEEGEIAELVVGYRSGGSEAADAYRALSRECRPLPPGSVRRAGLLEEHRFFLRRDDRPPGAAASHRLSRIRFHPGSDRVHATSPRSGVALVDHALDLQVALGFDLDGDGSIVEGRGAGRGSDEWLHNHPGDATGSPSWSRGRLELVRSTVLLRSARPSRGHPSRSRDRLEDHLYGATDDRRDLDRRLFLRGSTSAIVRPRGG